MRIVQACAIAALIGFSGAAFAQNTQSTTPGQVNSTGTLPGTNNPNNGGPGSNLTGAVSGENGTMGAMHEGRASAPDARYGTMRNRSMRNGEAMRHQKPMGNRNGNNMSGSNGE